MPYEFSSQTHTCLLETHTCEWKNGCKRRVAIGLPLCWQHSRKQYGVRTGPSSIPGAGKGLFAVRDFAKGDVICPYGGRLLTGEQVERLYPGETLAPYVERVSRDVYRDAACVRGIGSVANGMRLKSESNAETFVRRTRVPWLRALKHIPEGTEILNHYGNEYFSHPNIHTSTTRRVRSPPEKR